MKISVIIPTHNRKANIELTLTALKMQEDINKDDFEVILVDDGGNDGTEELVSLFKDEFAFKYAWINKKDDWNASRPRNYGAKLAEKTSEAFLFVDSDVLLNRKALSSYLSKLQYAQEIQAVILGPYNWLPPQSLVAEDIELRFDEVISGRRPARIPQSRGSHVGEELRKISFEEKILGNEIYDGLACFGGNILFPKEIFYKVGGYDEETLCGLEDGEMGIRLWKQDFKFLYNKQAIGYHVWHEVSPSRFPPNMKEQINRLNQKHFHENDPDLGLVNASKEAYKRWGIDWEVPEEWR